MMCRRPYVGINGAYGCGQCMPCRVNKRRVWAHRLMLEASLYKDNAFVTLTYNDESLVKTSDGKATLCPDDLKNFLKRLRRRFEPTRLRFFAVGEYGHDGTRLWNPHYHLALFNYPGCSYCVANVGAQYRQCDCAVCKLISECWRNKDRSSKGLTHNGVLAPESADYICGYVTKKMTDGDNPKLGGRAPEFTRMSLKPRAKGEPGGIGGEAMHEVGDAVLRFDLVEREGDVPGQLRHGRVRKPLGRYLRRQLRRICGEEESAPDSTLAAAAEELREVCARPEIIEKGGAAEALAANDDVRVMQMEKRNERKKGKTYSSGVPKGVKVAARGRGEGS